MIDYARAGRILDAMAEAWVAFDGDAWVNLFSEDAQLHQDPLAEPLIGHNALRANLLDAARIEEQVEFTWVRHWFVPPTILASWRMRYVHRETRAGVSFDGFAILEVAADGRIARARCWYFRHETPAAG